MAEVKRVLRPGGKFLFMEHIGAKRGGILRTMQQLINPLWKFSFENCNLDRDTLAQIRRSGGSNFSAPAQQLVLASGCSRLCLIPPAKACLAGPFSLASGVGGAITLATPVL